MKKKFFVIFCLLVSSFFCFAEKTLKISEFINIETCFMFDNSQTHSLKKNVYGTMYFSEDATEIISANAGETVILTITFSPTVLKEKMNSVKKEYSDIENIDIPVKLVFKGKNCELKYVDARNLDNFEKTSSKSNADCKFTIKNLIDKKRLIKIEIKGIEKGAYEQVFVTYGSDEYPLVETSCNVFETIQFN